MTELLKPILIECGDAEEPFVYELICRRPTPNEAAQYLDQYAKTESALPTINFVKSIVQTVNGQSGLNAIKLIDEMADACEGYEMVAELALLSVGYPKANTARILTLRADTSAADLEKMGLPSNVIELKQVYKPPRQLKAFKFDGFPTVVLVTPTVSDVEAKERTSKDSAVRARADLGASCAVWPSLEARMEIWREHPGLAFQLGVEALRMRDAIKGAEKKG